MAWLVTIFLAQAAGYWVDFEICQVDHSVLPHVSRRPDPQQVMSVWITNERKPGLFSIFPEPEGLPCTQLVYRGQTIYVIGTRGQVKRKLDGN